MKRSMRLFVCGVDWQHECEDVPHAVSFFGSVKELKAHKKCWPRCGIVELKATEVRWAKKQDFSEYEKPKRKSSSSPKKRRKSRQT